MPAHPPPHRLRSSWCSSLFGWSQLSNSGYSWPTPLLPWYINCTTWSEDFHLRPGDLFISFCLRNCAYTPHTDTRFRASRPSRCCTGNSHSHRRERSPRCNRCHCFSSRCVSWQFSQAALDRNRPFRISPGELLFP